MPSNLLQVMASLPPLTLPYSATPPPPHLTGASQASQVVVWPSLPPSPPLPHLTGASQASQVVVWPPLPPYLLPPPFLTSQVRARPARLGSLSMSEATRMISWRPEEEGHRAEEAEGPAATCLQATTTKRATCMQQLTTSEPVCVCVWCVCVCVCVCVVCVCVCQGLT